VAVAVAGMTDKSAAGLAAASTAVRSSPADVGHRAAQQTVFVVAVVAVAAVGVTVVVVAVVGVLAAGSLGPFVVSALPKYIKTTRK